MAPTALRIVSESPAPDRTNHSVFIALTVMSAQALSVFHPEAIPYDHEELYNAVHAQLIGLEHMDYLFDLQYRGHCGGCTQHALLGAGLFAILGPSLFAWKLIPILWIGVMAYAGSRFLRKQVGLMAALVFGTLLVLPPPTFLELSLTAWGNHFESGVASVVVLWATSHLIDKPSLLRAGTLGLLLSWALWVGFSSAFLLLALPFLVWNHLRVRHWIAIGMGLSAVVTLWISQHLSSLSSPFETIYYAGESVPSLFRIPTKLWSLIGPRQLVALFGSPDSKWEWAAGVLAGGSFLIAGWQARKVRAAPLVFKALAGFLLVYCTVRFTVWTPPAPEIAPPGSMRYAAPLFGLVFLILSMGFQTLWNQNKRVFAIALVAPLFAVGFQARSHHFDPPFPDKSVFNMLATDFQYSRDQAAYTIALDDHKGCQSVDPQAKAFHSYAIGWHETRQALDRQPNGELPFPSVSNTAAWEGLAAALLSEIDPHEKAGVHTLKLMEQRTEHFDEDARLQILVSAAHRRHWFNGLPPNHDSTRIAAFGVMVEPHPKIIQRALTRELGFRWAKSIARWRSPTRLSTPSVESLQHPEEFVQGYGEAIGERWGPGEWSAPPALSIHRATWENALGRGVTRRWISTTH